MPGVDPPALPQEVTHGGRTAVEDDRLRLVDQPVPELADQCLDGNLVDRRVQRDAGDHVAEGHDLAQFWFVPGNPVMQTPLEVDSVAEEGFLAVDGRRMPADHANRRIVEGAQESLESPFL